MIYIIIAVLLFAADQATKLLTVHFLNEGQSVSIIDNILDFTRCHNTGGPWSIFDQSRWIFITVTVIVLAAEIFYIKKYGPKHTLSKLSLSLITAGALGNFVDRLFRGYVVDMIDVNFFNYPVFNFADICIVVGCVILCVYVLFIYKEPTGGKKDGEDKNGNNKTDMQ